MPPSSFGFLLIFALALFLVTRYALAWLLYGLPRRHGMLLGFAIASLGVAAMFFIPTRDPARRRSVGTTWAAVLVVAGIVGAASSLRRQRGRRKFADWAIPHGFTVTSESLSPAQETLPQSMQQLPLLRRGDETETFFVLEQEHDVQNLRTLIFGFLTRRVFFSPAAMRPVQRRHSMTVFAFRRPAHHWPAFELRPAEVAKKKPDGDPIWPEVGLSTKPRFQARYALCSPDGAKAKHLLSDELASALERQPGWCVEGFEEWCVAYRYHEATFWSLRPSGFEYYTDPDQLSARLETARHLVGLLAARHC